MRQNSFITFFITAHIILIFLQVHKHTLFIKNNYDQQEYEKKITALTEKKQILTQKFHAMNNLEEIKKFAYNKLQMKPYNLRQITKLSEHDTKL